MSRRKGTRTIDDQVFTRLSASREVAGRKARAVGMLHGEFDQLIVSAWRCILCQVGDYPSLEFVVSFLSPNSLNEYSAFEVRVLLSLFFRSFWTGGVSS
jgi:hypothetical protein